MTWTGFLLSLPMTLLAGTMTVQFYLDEDAVTRLSLRSQDVRIAIQLMIVGFVLEGIPRLVNVIPRSSNTTSLSIIAGSGATVMLTAAFFIMNIVMRGPENRLYRYLPSRFMGKSSS